MTPSWVHARRHRSVRRAANSFAYFLLVLSYTPDFCADASGTKDPQECGQGKQTGFVVHGLWPQGETTHGPEHCGPAGTIPVATIQTMLKYFPSESLIRHEWQAHGTCSGMKANDYFAAVRTSRDSVVIPKELTPTVPESIGTAVISGKLANANPAIPASAVRITCYPNADLQEIRICLTKELAPRACSTSAGACTAKTVSLKPVQ